MLRQLSINLDYFLINNNIFSNKKIMLLQARFPFTGFTLFIYLLTEIYSSHGYYAKLTVDDFEIIAIKFGIDKEEMIKILNFFFDYEMFDKKIYKKYAVLTSKGIQERYLSAKLKGRFINCMISKQLICLNLDFVLKNLAQRNNSETSKTRYNEYLEKIQYENTLEVAPALTDLSLLVRNTRKELMLHLPKQKRTSKVQNVTSDCNINEMPDVQNANINEIPDVQNVTSQCNNFGTIQDKTRQDKTRQDKTRQDKTRQDNTRYPPNPLKRGLFRK